ncbi:MAG: iron uptake transporter permease EfeU [Solirubrobacterales bacterium]
MIPSFVVTLREGVEASLIIGIVAAFLVRQGRADALRQVWIGVGIAVALCVAVGVGLRIAGNELPEEQQEGLATIIALVAVGAITYMIVWMRRHARSIKSALEGDVAAALAAGSAMALVAMAFLAVLREGFETSVFLLAAFEDASDPLAAGAGAVLGLVVAVAIGLGLYRGGVKLNLGRFFRVTGVILVFVAAGLLASAAHTAEEAGWISGLQGQAVDLTWLVKEGTVSGSLLTGMLGLRPEPTVIEALLYVLYAVPMTIYVLWPERQRASRREPESDARRSMPAELPA